MRPPLEEWLLDYVCKEVDAAISWKKSINAGIKRDPESRFSDDGSNFRSTVSLPLSGRARMVQLIKVST